MPDDDHSNADRLIAESRRFGDPKACRPAVDLFRYAWEDCPEETDWLAAIPPEVRAAARERVKSTSTAADDEDDLDDDDEPAPSPT